jgi:transcriptional regulator with XRE-family HTH domain
MPKRAGYQLNRTPKPVFFAEWREAFDLTQDQLATLMGTTKTRISEKETGKEIYDQWFIEAFEEVLQVPLAIFLTRPPTEDERLLIRARKLEQERPGTLLPTTERSRRRVRSR